MPAALLSRGAQLCIDLRKVRETRPDVLAQWRADYLKGSEESSLLFATPTGMVQRERIDGRDEETAIKLRIDGGWARKDELYTPAELRDLIDSENKNAFDILVAQLRSPVGVVPFVGAGLSVPFGFPGWPKFLREAAAFHPSPGEALSLVKRNRLIEAASLLYKPSPDRFQKLVEKWFGAPVAEDQVRKGAVSLLPLIAKGPSITTNFDRVLEAAFRTAQAPFDEIITGSEPDNVIRAMHRNEHALIKIHGDALDRSARVFTGLEYQQTYGAGQPGKNRKGRSGIPTLARIMFTNRPLLFLGCSLEKDLTLDVLKDLHDEIPGVTHYAIIAASHSIQKLRRRRSELDKYGISPLWFLPGDFAGIETILAELVQEASTRLIWRNPKPEAAWPKATIAKLSSTKRARKATPKADDKITLFTRRLAPRLARGDLVFFLGAGIHLGLLLSAHDFYSSLAKKYGFSEKHAQRAEVAQYLIDREGKAQAWTATKQTIAPTHNKLSAVCEFFADLPALLRQLGKSDAAHQWLLTTNYDTVLEQALADRGERFHLLSYQADGRNEGHFAHRDLAGSIRIVEQPQNVHSLGSPASAIVKLDGGISWDPNIPETVTVSPLDFSVSSGRLPTALPEAVRHVLRTRSLLVLGSSLRDAHVQRLVRWSAGNSRAIKTWAVLKPVSASARQYWPAAGVELVECDLAVFVQSLRQELESFVRQAPR